MSRKTQAPALAGERERSYAGRESPAASHAVAAPPLVRDPRFRRAWAASAALHILLFGWAAFAPTESKARFYGSGTAVSLVGADQIPGGSAKGKSGDRPESLRETPPPAAEKPAPKPPEKKEAGPSQAELENIRRIRQLQTEKERKEKAELDRKEQERQARLKEIRERRAGEERWRREYEARLKKEQPAQTARAQTPPPPPVGHLGEGGGDGQGGGSIGGGGGGVARSDLERYYGLLAERVRNFWTVPLSLTGLEKLSTAIAVDVALDGSFRGLKIERSSGNRVYDDAALRAVERAAAPSFPAPPNTVRENWLALGFRFCGASFCP
ncbi:MAG: TonB family protein [Nitrospinota bacterium]